MDVCGFTGYRFSKLPYKREETHPDCIALKHALREEIDRMLLQGTRHFICGGAQGVDTFAAEIILSFLAAYPDIYLEIAVPYVEQAQNWRQEDQLRYHRILEAAQRITYVQIAKTSRAMYHRNQYIVDHADRMIAVYDGKPGGTKNTILYAKKMNKSLTVFSPAGVRQTQYE